MVHRTTSGLWFLVRTYITCNENNIDFAGGTKLSAAAVVTSIWTEEKEGDMSGNRGICNKEMYVYFECINVQACVLRNLSHFRCWRIMSDIIVSIYMFKISFIGLYWLKRGLLSRSCY